MATMKKAAPQSDHKGKQAKRIRRQETMTSSSSSSEAMPRSDDVSSSSFPAPSGQNATTRAAATVSSEQSDSVAARGAEAFSSTFGAQERSTAFHSVDSRLGLPLFAHANAVPTFRNPTNMDNASQLIHNLLGASSTAPLLPLFAPNSSTHVHDLLLRASMLPSRPFPGESTANNPIPIVDAASFNVLNTLQLQMQLQQASSTPSIDQMIANLLRAAPQTYDRNEPSAPSFPRMAMGPHMQVHPSADIAAPTYFAHSAPDLPLPALPPPVNAVAAVAVAQRRPGSAPARPNGRDGGVTTLSRAPMSCGSDPQVLSEFQCLLRQQVEYFAVGPEDASVTAQGRNKPVRLGQVGIRCVHCAQIPPKRRQRGAVYFPAKLLSIYQSVQNMSVNHFTEGRCAHLPSPLQTKLTALKDKKCYVHGGGKQYWANTAESLGVTESDDGLEFSGAPSF